jgi:hypothetical protein
LPELFQALILIKLAAGIGLPEVVLLGIFTSKGSPFRSLTWLKKTVIASVVDNPNFLNIFSVSALWQ